jgi:ribosomal protein S6--L-glutamate ligase
MDSRVRFIALGSRLKGVPEVLTLGVRPNFLDYTRMEQEQILGAEAVLYPSQNYAQFLSTMGKRIFPSLETHLYADEKIKQTTLFYMLRIPHPRTRFYFHLHHQEILKDFYFPLVGKRARASARGRGVFKITRLEELDEYLRKNPIAYIQEFLPHERDLRVVLLNYSPILAYWRETPAGDFRANLSRGGTIRFEDLPREGIELACAAARKCKMDDVGLDLIHSGGKWYVIEANMKYGREGLRRKHIDIEVVLREKLLSGELLSPPSEVFPQGVK